jgi:DNA-binding IclR family transcriptional regulator
MQTLDRALAVLGLFRPESPEWAAAEVARELGLSLPTASRLMRGLEVRGLLMRTGGRRYRLGFAAVELGLRALKTLELREVLRPIVLQLAHDSGETCVLAAISEHRDAARVLDRAEGRQPVRISLEIGHTWPLHAGALGKALLAHMPERDAVLEQPLTKIGKHTVTDRGLLEEQLETIRKVGWAFSSEETEIGAWGVAGAVLDDHGLPVCSIGLIAPLERKSQRAQDRLVGLLADGIVAARERFGLRLNSEGHGG